MKTIINSSTAFKIASFKLNGKKVELIPSEMERSGNKLYREIDGLRAYIDFEPSDEYGLWTLSFENTGSENSKQISCVRSLDIDIKSESAAKLHTLKGDNCSKESFFPIDMTLDSQLTVKPVGGRSSCTTGFPYFDIFADGTAYLFSIGWTGQWIYELTPSCGSLNAAAGIENADFYLRPNERVRCPLIFVMTGDEPAALRRSFKKVQYRDFNPAAVTGKDTLPFSIQPYDRYFYGQCPEWPTEAGQLRTLENALKCKHFDTLWIDAAWFKNGFPHGVGNYSFESGFPNGLKPVSDAVHKAGLRFMVWFEPERIYEGSEIFENHQEFLLEADDPKTRLYNLGDPEAWDWLHNTLKNFIAVNGIDNYRQDFNFPPLKYWMRNDEENRLGISEMKYVEGLYRLWDALKSDFPALFIDDCSSGGRRIDFETMRRAAPMWRSDITCGPATETNHTYTWNQNETLVLSEYLNYHACAVWEPIAYQARSAATAGLACTFDVLNPDYDFDKAEKTLGEAVRLAKYWKYDFYPMSEYTNDETGFAAWRFEDNGAGCAYIFRRNECESDTYTLKIPTLSPDSEYRLTMTDENYNTSESIASGSGLVAGIEVKLDSPMSSMVVEYSLK